MAVAAKRVWEELYISKKPAIEEVKIVQPLSVCVCFKKYSKFIFIIDNGILSTYHFHMAS